MRRAGVLIGVGAAALACVSCGWSPSGPPPTPPDTCRVADGPTAETVDRAIAGVPAAGTPWVQADSGHTPDCGLYWVHIAPEQAERDSPQQVLFFAGDTALGPATPQPRPYITVLSSPSDVVTVQYQWLRNGEQPCCPTGIGTVRFHVGDDGKLAALDPIPG